MGFQVFTEKEINLAIYRKVPLEKIKGKKHKMGDLVVDGKFYGKVKIPNPHKNEFKENKAKRLAGQLNICDKEYNELIKCTLKKADYIEILKGLQ